MCHFQGQRVKMEYNKYISIRKIYKLFYRGNLLLWGKCLRDLWREKCNNTSNLRRAVILSSERCERKLHIKFEVIRYIDIIGMYFGLKRATGHKDTRCYTKPCEDPPSPVLRLCGDITDPSCKKSLQNVPSKCLIITSMAATKRWCRCLK